MNLDKYEEVYLYFDYGKFNIDIEDDIDEPTTLTILINQDSSLLDVHYGVRLRYSFEKYIILLYENYKKEIDIKIKENKNSESLKMKRDKIVEKLNKFTNSYLTWRKYKELSKPILLRYLNYMTNVEKGTISFKTLTLDDFNTKIEIIHEFINMVNDTCTISIKPFYMTELSTLCQYCDSDKGENIDICENCGHINDVSTDFPLEECSKTEEDIKTTNTNPKPQIEWLTLFLVEGSYPDLNKKLFKQLDKICKENGLPTSKDIKEGREEGSLDLLFKIMKYGKINYKYRNPLRHKYWNWEMPVITNSQKEQFIKDCTRSRLCYPKFSERKQNLNLDVSGYLLFTAQEIYFPNSYFKFPKNINIIRSANYVWEKICDHIELNYSPIDINKEN